MMFHVKQSSGSPHLLKWLERTERIGTGHALTGHRDLGALRDSFQSCAFMRNFSSFQIYVPYNAHS